jgi:hypothetical protein
LQFSTFFLCVKTETSDWRNLISPNFQRGDGKILAA